MGQSPQHAPCVRTTARRMGTHPWRHPRPTRHHPRRPLLHTCMPAPARMTVKRCMQTAACIAVAQKCRMLRPPRGVPSGGELSGDEPVPTKSMVPRNHTTLNPMNSAYSSLRLLGGPALRRLLLPVVAGSMSIRESHWFSRGRGSLLSYRIVSTVARRSRYTVQPSTAHPVF